MTGPRIRADSADRRGSKNIREHPRGCHALTTRLRRVSMADSMATPASAGEAMAPHVLYPSASRDQLVWNVPSRSVRW